jgi:hypothetical protein
MEIKKTGGLSLAENGKGVTAPRITDNRVMAQNEWSEIKKLNKILHINMSSNHCIMYF